MNNFAGTDWAKILQPVAYLDFRQKNLNIKMGSGDATLTNGFPVMTGKFSQGIYLGGQKYQTTNKANYLSFSRGTQISGNNYTNINTNQGTISFWIKPYWDGSDGLNHTIFSSSGDGRILLEKQSSGTLIFQIYNSGITTQAFFASEDISAWTAGTWYYLTIRWSASQYVTGSYNIEMLINNTQVDARAMVGSTVAAPTSTMYIGCRGYDSYVRPTEAILDDFAIWDRVLTDAEITDLYNSGTGKVASTYADSHLKLYLPFDATAAYSGTGLGCSAGNMRTGNLVVDGDMETAGTGNYAVITDGTVSKVTSGQCFDTQALRIQGVSAGSGGKHNTVTVVSGTTYHIEFWYKVAAGTMYVEWNNGATPYSLKTGITDASWTKFETEIKADSTSLLIHFRQTGGTALDVYIDDLIIVANKVANGGFEGTYVSGVAPDWSQNGSPTPVESADENTGSKAQEGQTLGTGSAFIHQSVSLTVSKWYFLNAYIKNITGNPAIILQYTAGSTLLSLINNVTSWTKVSGIAKPSSVSSPRIILYKIGSDADAIFDDLFLFEMSDVDITLNYLAEADLWENNGSKVGITLGGQYLTIPRPDSIAATGNMSVLLTLVPLDIYNLETNRILFASYSGSLQILYDATGDKLQVTINSTSFYSSTLYTSNALLQTRMRIIVSIDYTNNIYEIFINGVKVGGYYSSITAASYSTPFYIGRSSNGYSIPFLMNVEKVVLFNRPIAIHQAIGMDNAYEYAM